MQAGARIGRWIVEAELGRGGHGAVYRCHHVDEPELLAAVKVLLRLDTELVMRFTQEATRLRTLSHPSVMRVLQLGLDNGQPWFAAEYIAGSSLSAELVRCGGRLPEPRTRAILARLADALIYCHDQGVWHRDVKPANVMIGDDGRVVLVDFGIAREAAISDLTDTGVVAGTQRYMAPERYHGRPIDERAADVWALARMLGELLGSPAPGGTLASAVSPDLMDLCLAGTDPDPARRPPLEAFVAVGSVPSDATTGSVMGRPPVSHPSGAPTALVANRAPLWGMLAVGAALAIVGLGALVAGGGGWWWFHRSVPVVTVELFEPAPAPALPDVPTAEPEVAAAVAVVHPPPRLRPEQAPPEQAPPEQAPPEQAPPEQPVGAGLDAPGFASSATDAQIAAAQRGSEDGQRAYVVENSTASTLAARMPELADCETARAWLPQTYTSGDARVAEQRAAACARCLVQYAPHRSKNADCGDDDDYRLRNGYCVHDLTQYCPPELIRKYAQ